MDVPLSKLQSGIWYASQMSPGSPQFHGVSAFRVRAPLDLQALGNAWRAFAARHPVLRTAYYEIDAQPFQRVDENLAPELAIRDMDGATEDALRMAAVEEYSRPFDFARGTARLSVLKRAANDFVIVNTSHHIAHDLESADMTLAELPRLYAAARTGLAPDLPPISATYADFVQWETETLGGPRGEALRKFWKEEFATLPPPLALPTDKPRPRMRRAQGSSVPFVVSEPVVAKLRAVSKGSSFYRTLLTAYCTLLYKYTGQTDFVVATPANVRTPAFEGVFGDFVNMLPLRVRISRASTFATLLDEVRDVVARATAHREFPFREMVALLKPDVDPSRTPIYQTSFSLVRQRRVPSMSGHSIAGTHCHGELGDLSGDAYFIAQHRGQLDTSVTCTEFEGRLYAELKYDVDLFEEATMTRMAENFCTLLESVSQNPTAPLWALDCLGPSERRISGAGRKAENPTTSLHGMFESQADRTPNAVAVEIEDKKLTFSELDRRSNQLGHALRALGVREGTCVGLCVERSLEMVVGMLGIMKAGGAYAPLDPSYPATRLAQMLEDLHAPIFLTQAHLRDRLPADARCLVLDAEWPKVAEHAEARPNLPVGPLQPAYVIFTSGSTGRPKGAVIHHEAIVNHTLWMQHDYPLGPDDAWFQKTPFSFDASVFEFHNALTFGARLVLAKPEGHKDPAYLARTVLDHRTTLLQMVPAMLGPLLDEPGFADGGPLRRLYAGGEALTPELVRRFQERSPIPLINVYGPTECTIVSTSWVATDKPSVVRIGSAIANATTYVLDEDYRIMPAGAVGELYIGGAGVGLGYLLRPALTAEKFVPDPFSTESGARLYRTGDLVRRMPDGELEYLGRRDNQIKIRGLRVELGEIEAAMESHPAITQALVLARDEPGGKRLVGYLMCSPATLPKDLQRMLRERLPEHMVPSSFVCLERFPLTPSGKVDRKALPVPDEQRAPRSIVPPATTLEEVALNVCRTILQSTDIGVTDDLFELGADSLQTIRIASRLRHALARDVSVHAVRENPSVRALIRALEQKGERVGLLVPLNAADADAPPIFCVHPMGGSVLRFLPLARHLTPRRSVFGLQASGIEGDSSPHRTVAEMAESYTTEIQRLSAAKNVSILGWSFGGVIALEMTRILARAGVTVDLTVVDSRLPCEYAGLANDDIEALRYFASDLTGKMPDRAEVEGWGTDWSSKLGMGEDDVLRRLFAVYRAHFGALLTHQPEPLPVKVRYIATTQTTSPESLGFWRELVSEVDVHTLEGDHFTVLEGKSAEILSKLLA